MIRDRVMNEDEDEVWPTAEEKAKNIAQAKALREQAKKRWAPLRSLFAVRFGRMATWID
jgi:hypothetical protein